MYFHLADSGSQASAQRLTAALDDGSGARRSRAHHQALRSPRSDPSREPRGKPPAFDLRRAARSAPGRPDRATHLLRPRDPRPSLPRRRPSSAPRLDHARPSPLCTQDVPACRHASEGRVRRGLSGHVHDVQRVSPNHRPPAESAMRCRSERSARPLDHPPEGAWDSHRASAGPASHVPDLRRPSRELTTLPARSG